MEDPEDDWLGIDIARGTLSAGEYLSNDQVVGCVYISQKENPKLKDKTNREGLIEEGGALSDFVDLLNIILRYIRRKYYAQYLIGKKQKKQFKESKEKRPETILNIAKEQFKDNKSVLDFINKFEFSYKKRKTILG